MARELGLDPKSVTAFLRGAEPRASTRARLLDWYMAAVTRGELSATTDLTARAIEILLRELEPSRAAVAAREVIAAVRRVYEADGAVPEWVARLDAEFAARSQQ